MHQRYLEYYQNLLQKQVNLIEILIKIQNQEDCFEHLISKVKKSLIFNQTTLIRNKQVLEKVLEGHYELCSNCDKKISPRRLLILPYTTLCQECQLIIESSEDFTQGLNQ